ncbi:MAG: hypothetical protein OXI03_05770, partial [Chloroflexota bacterium]|nr:hypothetical protein [Chloroflexota bacterium]
GRGPGADDDDAPVDTAPGRLAGRADVPGEDDQSLDAGPAAEALREAIQAFDRNNPTLEEALAILEALRAVEETRGASGMLGVEVAGQDDY